MLLVFPCCTETSIFFYSSSKKNSWFWWTLYVALSMFSGAAWVWSSVLHGQWMGRGAPAGKAPGEGTTKLQGARWRCGVSREAEEHQHLVKVCLKARSRASLFFFSFSL